MFAVHLFTFFSLLLYCSCKDSSLRFSDWLIYNFFLQIHFHPFIFDLGTVRDQWLKQAKGRTGCAGRLKKKKISQNEIKYGFIGAQSWWLDKYQMNRFIRIRGNVTEHKIIDISSKQWVSFCRSFHAQSFFQSDNILKTISEFKFTGHSKWVDKSNKFFRNRLL